MDSLSFWLADWEYECCGDQRKVGDEISIRLSFDGSVQATDEADRIEDSKDGGALLIGSTHSFDSITFPWLLRVGSIDVGVARNPNFARVKGEGRLWEERHDDSPTTTGRVTLIQWWRAVYQQGSDGVFQPIGYDDPQTIYNTEKRPGYPSESDLAIQRWSKQAKSIGFKGPLTITPANMDGFVPSGWAFRFTLDIAA